MANFRAQFVARRLELSGHMDGLAVRLGPEVVLVSPDYEGASEAFKAAREGLAMLAACLANAKT